MDLPKPPQDVELRNIIDKLAQFVARNGPEFEQMTKNKQKGNPKFGFLFGGEHFNYYQYKVTTEQAILKKQKQSSSTVAVSAVSQPSLSSLVMAAAASSSTSQALQQAVTNFPALVSGSTLNIAAQWLAAAQSQVQQTTATDSLAQQQATLQDQIRQSEQNLSAQHAVLMQQQQTAIEDTIEQTRKDKLLAEANDCNIQFNEFDAVLQPIIDSCTKDSISNGKAVLEPGRTFLHKLHIIYLVNDILHHCARKNVDSMRKSLESVVVPMFCNTALDVTEEQKSKLNKLLNLWETKNHYCSAETVGKLKNPAQSWADYQSQLIADNHEIATPIINNMKSTLQNYTAQHQAFVSHALQQIQSLEQQKLEVQQKQQQAPVTVPTVTNSQPEVTGLPPTTTSTQQQQLPCVNIDQQQLACVNIDQQQLLLLQQTVLSQMQMQQQQPPTTTDPQQQQQATPQQQQQLTERVMTPPPPMLTGGDIGEGGPPPPMGLENISFSQPPPGFSPHIPPPGIALPDFSQPPPGFPAVPPPPQISDVMPDDLLPSLPYYDLPAGLMVPLIRLEDCEYKPLDPDAIRLPPPAPPSERLLAAFKQFYLPPGHSHPLDSEGWEKLGLYEYYRAKNTAKKKKDDDIAAGRRMKSRSPSPISRSKSKSKTPPPKRRYRSRSRSRSKGRSPVRRNSGGSSNNSNNNNSQNQNSGGGGVARRRLNSGRRSGGGGGERSRSRSRSPLSPLNTNTTPQKQLIDRDRSPTPPSFAGGAYGKISLERLDESNKGHQMLRKMGWGGAGLGVKEQGIEQPISGGEIRDRTDQYKGVGLNLNDPYENFRKSKGQAFITRMKARAEERGQEREATAAAASPERD
ncbi:calcium homeostasis endoplasmic reticulum protein [Nilaparvata lugens]|uniref:calcium homeostasis endoplasmic reticulum protein n=1 Tax=Nilaparvata lugens TaxID=108931 RepID=UPI00193D0539|nr:calcium homeostasis endoplasmic reticulum protein [Nilaparvata lugens]